MTNVSPPAAAVIREDVAAAEARIRPHVRRTPQIAVAPRDLGLAGSFSLSLKLEFLQHAGSFKPRGAFSHLTSGATPAAGVAAASGGNHGAAVAFAAGRLGVPAKVFVPTVCPPAKRAAIEGAGAELVVAGDLYADALEACEAYVADSGARSIHAYDQPETLAGQGTVGLEIEADGAAETVLVATGGGGLVGGIAAALEDRARVVAVEPETAPTLHAALAAGGPVDAPAGGIAADSLAPKRIGVLPYQLAARWGVRSALVPDDAIRGAQAALWRTLRIIAEPGGAAALAALASGAYAPAPGERVVVLVCGANTDPAAVAAMV